MAMINGHWWSLKENIYMGASRFMYIYSFILIYITFGLYWITSWHFSPWAAMYAT